MKKINVYDDFFTNSFRSNAAYGVKSCNYNQIRKKA